MSATSVHVAFMKVGAMFPVFMKVPLQRWAATSEGEKNRICGPWDYIDAFHTPHAADVSDMAVKTNEHVRGICTVDTLTEIALKQI